MDANKNSRHNQARSTIIANQNYSRWILKIQSILLIMIVTLSQSTVDGDNIRRTRNIRHSKIRSGDDLHVVCGFQICDLRTHYCDSVINTCARCADDCHPGRINGDLDATAECRRICKYYYKFKTTTTPRPLTTTVLQKSQNNSSLSGNSQSGTYAQLLQQVESQSNLMEHLQTSLTIQSTSIVIIAILLFLLVVAVITWIVFNVFQQTRNRSKFRSIPSDDFKESHRNIYNPPCYEKQRVVLQA